MKWWDSLPVRIQQMLVTYVQIGTGNSNFYFNAGAVPWPVDEAMQGKLARAYLELQQHFG